jgi:Ferritin-like domain
MYSTRDSHPLQLSDDAKTPKCRGLCAPGRAHCRIARAREPTPGDTEIATDGSDVKESSVVVPKRSLQFEDGTTWTRDQKDQNIDFSQTLIPFEVSTNTLGADQTGKAGGHRHLGGVLSSLNSFRSLGSTFLSFSCLARNISALHGVHTVADQVGKSELGKSGALSMKEENFSSSIESTTESGEPNSQLACDKLQHRWQDVVKRRSFLKGISIAGATLTAGALMGKQLRAETTSSSRRLSKDDAALLRFAAAVELIEADLWQQYNELGGVEGGNPAYMAALSNLDGDMPQYIADNTDDELSHAAFLNAYLVSRGAEPVDLDAFRTLPSSQATGAKNTGRLTNLLKLNVDLSWYTRYRSGKNPDLRAQFEGPFKIENQPAIPISDTDTPPNTVLPSASSQTPGSSFTGDAARMQAIANTAGFHFAFIEQGGASLYPTLAFKARDPEVLRILVSIGGVEIDHFGLWHDKGGNAVNQPLALVTDPITGLTFPDLNARNSELDQTNLILPEPCQFISKELPRCSVIRPTTTRNGGAVATIKAFTDDLLFLGQIPAFFGLVNQLAAEADSVRGGF